MVELIQHAERIGLDEIWLGDEGPARDPLTVLPSRALTVKIGRAHV